LYSGYLAICCRPLPLHCIVLYTHWVAVLHCVALAQQLSCHSLWRLWCTLFTLSCYFHQTVRQAPSQWVLCLFNSLQILLIYLWLIAYVIVLFSENKHDDDDSECWNEHKWIRAKKSIQPALVSLPLKSACLWN